MSISTDNTTKAVSFFDFHGVTMLVAENGGKRYVEVKPLSDLLGMKWRTLRETVQAGDNQILYGTKRMVPPVFNVFVQKNSQVNESGIDVSGPPRGPLGIASDGADEGLATDNTSEIGVLFILFERVQMFLARVNTSQMRINGNVSGANYLLAIQIEWAQVLHQYEEGREVSKKSRDDDAKLIASLVKTRALCKPHEVGGFDRMVRDVMADMGYSAGLDPQTNLPFAS